MGEFPVATSPAPGVMGVDWEVRVDFERLRQHRIARVHQMLEEFDLGAVLLFETSNIRYATSTQIGYWAFNKGERYALVTRESAPGSGNLDLPQKPIDFNCLTCTTPRTLWEGTPACRGRSDLRRGFTPGPPRSSRGPRVSGSRRGETRCRSRRDRCLPGPSSRRPQRGRWPAGDDARAGDQEPRRDHPPHPGLRHGRRRVSGIFEMLKPGIRESDVVASPTPGCLRWGPSSSRPSTRSPGSAAPPIPTSSPTGSSGPVIRPTST